MRLERLDFDKIKIFLTYEDMEERGITTDETWSDIPVIDEIFQDMISEASDELDFNPHGPVMVEMFSVPSRGLVIIVTKSEDDEEESFFSEGDFTDEQLYSPGYVIKFSSLEHVISLAHLFSNQGISCGSLYNWKESYYVIFADGPVHGLNEQDLTSYIFEFGEKAEITGAFLEEYGTLIIPDNALSKLAIYFK